MIKVLMIIIYSGGHLGSGVTSQVVDGPSCGAAMFNLQDQKKTDPRVQTNDVEIICLPLDYMNK